MQQTFPYEMFSTKLQKATNWKRWRFVRLPNVFSRQKIFLIWLWKILNSNNILNYVAAVCVNNLQLGDNNYLSW